MLDAVLGEVIVTCEKLHWLIHEAEQHLKPESRASGVLVGGWHLAADLARGGGGGCAGMPWLQHTSVACCTCC
jgi:hypothetical protein